MVYQTSKFKAQTSDNIQTSKSENGIFDLEERMAVFGEEIVIFCRGLQVDHVSRPIVLNLCDRQQALVLTMLRLIMLAQRRIFEIRHTSLRKKLKKLSIGCGCSNHATRIIKMQLKLIGRRLTKLLLYCNPS